jgi:hypothetical protein
MVEEPSLFPHLSVFSSCNLASAPFSLLKIEGSQVSMTYKFILDKLCVPGYGEQRWVGACMRTHTHTHTHTYEAACTHLEGKRNMGNRIWYYTFLLFQGSSLLLLLPFSFSTKCYLPVFYLLVCWVLWKSTTFLLYLWWWWWWWPCFRCLLCAIHCDGYLNTF